MKSYGYLATQPIDSNPAESKEKLHEALHCWEVSVCYIPSH